jgi:hypothetical protein
VDSGHAVSRVGSHGIVTANDLIVHVAIGLQMACLYPLN